MTDNLDKATRSMIMSSIRGKNTRPETIIRKLVWSSGKRYRIHDRSVFGTPDISNKSKKIAVFIDGCFWHGCDTCYKEPTTNPSYWRSKIRNNKTRRELVLSRLKSQNWTVLQFWEHAVTQHPNQIARQIISKL